jgi:hypothetical protein
VVLVTGVAVLAWPGWPGHPPPALLSAEPTHTGHIQTTPAYRAELLQRARVWRPPHDRFSTSLTATPDPHRTFDASPVECRFEPDAVHGTTTKFDCVLASGEVVKVKYGATREIQAEVAGSRLLSRLGFGADDMFLVRVVRCYGCPRRPFELSWVAERLHLQDVVFRPFSAHQYVDFTWPSIERRSPGTAIEAGDTSGWAWYELTDLDASGDQRAERDALVLTAMLLAHWDNKSANQRLVCLDDEASSTQCVHPFAFIHDLGATFGPNKMDLSEWRRAPIWKDATQCVVSMRQFPYNGGTFKDTQITESGRQLLLHELDSISERDATAWLEAARFDKPGEWAGAFGEKVRHIRNAGPCPS